MLAEYWLKSALSVKQESALTGLGFDSLNMHQVKDVVAGSSPASGLRAGLAQSVERS